MICLGIEYFVRGFEVIFINHSFPNHRQRIFSIQFLDCSFVQFPRFGHGQKRSVQLTWFPCELRINLLGREYKYK